MTKYVILFIGLIVLASACNKQEYGYDFNFSGKAHAFMNGEFWTGGVLGKHTNDSVFTFNIIHRNKRGFQRGLLSFDAIPLKEGWTKLSEIPHDSVNLGFGIDSIPSVSFSTVLGDGHVLGDIFKLIEDREENYFKIEAIDEQRNRIEGIFSLGFEFDSVRNLGVRSDPSQPDTIIFQDGSFEFLLPK